MNWTDDELAIVAAHYPEHGAYWVGFESLLPGRTPNAIAHVAADHRIRSKGKYRRQRAKKAQTDSSEVAVRNLMKQGLTPTEIDARMHWTPGRAMEILKEMWGKL